ncbi:MAG: hypothetical protein F6J95_028590 [Leptolyngbya sp. SIO1E4]|nr:hypothetical protein [Leptolyngbya sp. SIO1E4]
MPTPRESFAAADDALNLPLEASPRPLGQTESPPHHRLPATAGSSHYVHRIWKWVWSWMTLALASSCTTSSVAFVALAHLVTPPPEVDCSTLRPGASDRATLSCLQVAIANGDSDAVLKALTWIGGWDSTHPLQNEVQALLETWSAKVLYAARQHQGAGRVAEAISLVSHIPHTSPRYTDAWTLLQQLYKQRAQLEQAVYQEAQKALQQQDWTQALRELWRLQALESETSPSGRAQTLAQQIEAERQAQRVLNQAIQKHSLGQPADWGEAITIASQIDPTTYVWQSARPLLDEWSDALLPVGLHHMEQGDLEGAMALIRQIAHHPNRQAIAQDWLILAQSRHLAQTSLQHSTTDLAAYVGLYPAILAAQSIQPESPRWSQASTHAQRWEQQLTLTPVSIKGATRSRAQLLPEAQYRPVFVQMQSSISRH